VAGCAQSGHPTQKRMSPGERALIGLRSIDPFTHTIDDPRQLACYVRIFRHPAIQGKGRGVEQPPRGLVPPIMWRLFVGLEHVTDPGQVDDARRYIDMIP
jgi:hypothetical protein